MRRPAWVFLVVCTALLLSDVGRNVLAAESAPVEWEPGLHAVFEGRAAYPRIVELADGTLFATFDHRTRTGRAIGSTQSIDGGRTWSEYQLVCEDSGRVDLANAFPLQLSDGTILVACRHHKPDARRYRLEVYEAVGHAQRWTLRSVLAEGTTGLWEPLLLLCPDGKLQAYYASEEGCHPDQRIEMRISADGGKTWGTPVIVAGKKGSRDGMPAVARLTTGELLAVFEAQDLPPYRFVLRGVRSADGGKSWASDRELVYRPSNPAPNRWSAGAPSLVVTGTGRVLVAFQTDEQVAYEQGHSDRDPANRSYNYLRHASLAYAASADIGTIWSRAWNILGDPGNPACWNALYPLRKGSILALTTHQGRVWCKIGRLTDEAAR